MNNGHIKIIIVLNIIIILLIGIMVFLLLNMRNEVSTLKNSNLSLQKSIKETGESVEYLKTRFNSVYGTPLNPKK